MEVINVLDNYNVLDLSDTFLEKKDIYNLKPFDSITIDFLERLSRSLLSDVSLKYKAEIVALGFWLRKSNIQVLKSQNEFLLDSNKYILSPLGKVFHVCPTNVDTMFVYSLVVSLLIGNRNVLRVSSRMKHESIDLLFNHINLLLNHNDFNILKQYILIIKYDHNKLINDWISSKVNVRIIWGGDKTIEIFKQSMGNPRLKDIIFSDRISISILKSNVINQYSDIDFAEFINRFYNDCYTFDQMGCSSPQSVIFIGSNNDSELCLSKIIASMTELALKKSLLDFNYLASLKLNRLMKDSIDEIVERKVGNNLVQFLCLKDDVDFTNLHSCGGGYFYFKSIKSIKDLNFQNAAKIQTITYEGIDNTEKDILIEYTNGEAIDRIVKTGNALNFDYVWDGYNLFDELSKKVVII